MVNYYLPKKILNGYGINSVIKVARKYNGDVIIEEEGGEFVITVIMNLENF